MTNDNSTSVVITLLKHLKIKVTATTITEELERHPDHSSLFAINDVLNYWRVPNGAFNVEFESLTEIPVPYVAHLTSNKGEFVVVTNADTENLYVSNEHWKNYKMPKRVFRSSFSGNILVAEANEEAAELEYKRNRQAELIDSLRYPLLISISCVILLLALFFNSSFVDNVDWPIIVLAVLKTAGLVISILLLIHSINSNNPLTERLCTGENNNCNAILSSKAAKITPYLSWSEVGFFYFSGTWLALLFNTGTGSLLQSLAWVNLLCLPYTLYSIYYQWKIAKQWCVFCTSIQAIFWLEFFGFSPYLRSSIVIPSLRNFSTLIICFAVPVLLWAFIKPFLLKFMEVAPLKMELKRFKYNSSFFNRSLKDQKRYELLEKSDTIILGNMHAKNTLTIVSNPYCQPCSRAHRVLNQWLSEKDNFKLQFVFSTENIDNGPKTKVARHLHQLEIENNESLKEAVHDWYEHKYTNFENWAAAYPVRGIGNYQSLEKQKSWCKYAEVTGTPTIFINGYKIPRPWRLEDIKYLV